MSVLQTSIYYNNPYNSPITIHITALTDCPLRYRSFRAPQITSASEIFRFFVSFVFGIYRPEIFGILGMLITSVSEISRFFVSFVFGIYRPQMFRILGMLITSASEIFHFFVSFVFGIYRPEIFGILEMLIPSASEIFRSFRAFRVQKT